MLLASVSLFSQTPQSRLAGNEAKSIQEVSGVDLDIFNPTLITSRCT